MDRITSQANDNFLWVRLVLDEIKECHIESDIKAVLDELPSGMESLYKRMENALYRKKRPSDMSLSHQLFLWAIYARRSPIISELCYQKFWKQSLALSWT